MELELQVDWSAAVEVVISGAVGSGARAVGSAARALAPAHLSTVQVAQSQSRLAWHAGRGWFLLTEHHDRRCASDRHRVPGRALVSPRPILLSAAVRRRCGQPSPAWLCPGPGDSDSDREILESWPA